GSPSGRSRAAHTSSSCARYRHASRIRASSSSDGQAASTGPAAARSPCAPSGDPCPILPAPAPARSPCVRPWAGGAARALRSAKRRDARVDACPSHLLRSLGSSLAVPVEDLFAVPMQHTVEAADIVVNLLEIFDPMRLPADVGVDRERHDLRALGALGIEPVELVDGALEQIVALVMLDD